MPVPAHRPFSLQPSAFSPEPAPHPDFRTHPSKDSAPGTPRPRSAFTAIELIVVLVIVFVLVGIGAVGIMPALREGRVTEAANAATDLAGNAMAKARLQRDLAATDLHGIRFDGASNPNKVVLVYGDPSGTPGEKRTQWLNANVQIFRGDSPLDGSWDCWFQPTTGFPVDPASGLVAPFAAGATGTTDHLSLRTLDGSFRRALAVYEAGIVHVARF